MTKDLNNKPDKKVAFWPNYAHYIQQNYTFFNFVNTFYTQKTLKIYN